MQSHEQALQDLVQHIEKLRSNVSVTLSDDAEKKLRQIFSLPEKTQLLVTARRIMNLLQFEDMHERFDDIAVAHKGTFDWVLDSKRAHKSG